MRRKVRITKFMKAIKDSLGFESVIAKRMGITRQSLNAWLQRNPEFIKYIEEEELRRVDKAENTIINDLGNVETAKWYMLKSKLGKKRGYGDVLEQNVNVKGEGIKLIIHEKNEK